MSALQLTLGLDEIAAEIHRVWTQTKRDQVAAMQGYVLTGSLLIEARSRFAGDREFGRWRKEQAFGFDRIWAWKLMAIATEQVLLSADNSTDIGVNAAYANILAHRRERAEASDRARIALLPEPSIALAGERFATIVIDPPWDPSDEGDVEPMRPAPPDYGLMPIEEIMALPIADHSMDNAHLYLWITNRSLPKGPALLAAWGFRYVTMLTWCKPSIGIGHYFRNSTEHLLFGVRGTLPFVEHDQGTWFQADRGPLGHSSKPDELYAIVRRVSPPPRLDWFGRREHEGFARFAG